MTYRVHDPQEVSWYPPPLQATEKARGYGVVDLPLPCYGAFFFPSNAVAESLNC
jgi:hypothetical protein